MRVLIADDEPVALQRLKLALSRMPEAILVAAVENGAQALSLVQELKPDVAILDVQMPVQSGIDVVTSLRNADFAPEIIFVTAFERYAVHAFGLMAVDYLLKPVEFERFREALSRAKHRLEARVAELRLSELERKLSSLQRDGTGASQRSADSDLWVRVREGITKVAAHTIDYFEAEGDYVAVHIGSDRHLIRDTISSLVARLNPEMFLRVHRSSIVNRSRIRSLRRRGKRSYAIVLQCGALISVGPSLHQEVLRSVNARRWR